MVSRTIVPISSGNREYPCHLIIINILEQEYKVWVERTQNNVNSWKGAKIYCSSNFEKLISQKYSILNRIVKCAHIDQVADIFTDALTLEIVCKNQNENCTSDNVATQLVNVLPIIGWGNIMQVDISYQWVEFMAERYRIRIEKISENRYQCLSHSSCYFENTEESWKGAVEHTISIAKALLDARETISQLRQLLMSLEEDPDEPFSLNAVLSPGTITKLSFNPLNLSCDGIVTWDSTLSLYENIFNNYPNAFKIKEQSSSLECQICSSFWLSSSMPCKILCNTCKAWYHEDCCRTWMESEPSSKRVFALFHGKCPLCDHPLQCPI